KTCSPREPRAAGERGRGTDHCCTTPHSALHATARIADGRAMLKNESATSVAAQPTETVHETVLCPRCLLAFAPYRPARSGAALRAGEDGHQDEEAGRRRGLLGDQPEGLRALPGAGHRRAPDRGPCHRAVHRRPGTGKEARPRKWHAAALPSAGVAELHYRGAAQGLWRLVHAHHAGGLQAHRARALDAAL